MSRQEQKEASRGLKGGIVIAVLLAIVLVAAPKQEALHAIPFAQAAAAQPDANVGGNGPTGYFPDRFRDAIGEDAPQVEAF